MDLVLGFVTTESAADRVVLQENASVGELLVTRHAILLHLVSLSQSQVLEHALRSALNLLVGKVR